MPEQLDLLDPDLYAGDPWPTYRWLRDNEPVYRDRNGIWCISRYRDVMDIEKDTRLYSSAHGSRPFIEMSDSMINKDDPTHLRQRKLVSPRFTPAAVRRHEDHVRSVVTDLLDAMAAKGEAEVVEELAAPLPAMIICEQLGFPRSEWPMCKRVSEATMANAGFMPGDPRQSDDSMTAAADFYVAVAALVEERRKDPQDDLVSVWTHSSVGGEPMPVSEIQNEAILLLDGGAETTRSVIGQMVLELDRHPDQRRALIRDPGLLRTTGVEEFIRWASPILNMRRTVTADHERHGRQLAEGEQVLLMYPSANRDERVFDQPEVFDVTRTHNHHVAFGFGTHFCLGANLARLELRVVFEELLRRFPDYRVVGPEPEFVPGFFTRTLRELRVELGPSAPLA